MAEPGTGFGGLGRGLGALIPSGKKQPPQTGFAQIAVEEIQPNPWQPREHFDPEALRELADSIREHGILQPIVVARVPGEGDAGYHLVLGERRLQAAKLAGLSRVPAIIRDVSPEEALELALVENIQRRDLTALEEAAAYKQLMDNFGLTQDQVATKVGRSRPSIANSIRLLGLGGSAKAALASGKVSEGHARALLGLDDAGLQDAGLEEVIRGQLSVRATEDLVRQWNAGAPPTLPPLPDVDKPETPPEVLAVEDALRSALGTRVKLVRKGQGGHLTIYFYNEEQLGSIYDQLIHD